MSQWTDVEDTFAVQGGGQSIAGASDCLLLGVLVKEARQLSAKDLIDSLDVGMDCELVLRKGMMKDQISGRSHDCRHLRLHSRQGDAVQSPLREFHAA